MTPVLSAGVKALLKQVPGVDIFVDVLDSIEEASDKRKNADEQLSQLDFMLSKWFKDDGLKTTADASTSDATDRDSTTTTDAVDEENAESVVDEIRKTIKDFHEYIQAKRKERNPENMRKRDKAKSLLRDIIHSEENEAVIQRIRVFRQEIQLSMYRLFIDSYDVIRTIRDSMRRLEATTKETRDDVRLIKTTLTNFIKNPRHDGVDLSTNEVELMMRIDKGDSNDDDWKELMRLFSKKPANERLKLSLQLIRLDDDNAKRMGLFNLDGLLHGNSNGLDIDGVLMDLIELARDVNEEVKGKASAILEMIAEKDELKARFFKRVRLLSESEVKKQAIAETIGTVIVDCARKVRESEESPERDAFDALRMLLETESCGLAIAEAGGIPALVKIYQVTCELLEQAQGDEREMLLETSMQTVKVLARLASHKECQTYFKMERDVWPFIHCLSEIHSRNRPRDDDNYPVTRKSTEDYKRYRSCIASAGRALWQLSLNDGNKYGLISLSRLYDEPIDGINRTLAEEPAAYCLNALLQWTRQFDSSKWVVEGWRLRDDLPHYEREAPIALYQEISDWLQRLSWSLAFDEDTGLAVAKCWYKTRFQYSNDIGSNVLESFEELFYELGDLEYWIKTVLQHVDVSDKMNTWVDFSSFLHFLVAKLEGSNAASMQKCRAAKVLWFCSLIRNDTDFSEIEVELAPRCEALIENVTEIGNADKDEMEQIFWATGILANLTCKRNNPRFKNAAIKGAQRIAETGSEKFEFLERFIAAW